VWSRGFDSAILVIDCALRAHGNLMAVGGAYVAAEIGQTTLYGAGAGDVLLFEVKQTN
jgi:hypothetical protein